MDGEVDFKVKELGDCCFPKSRWYTALPCRMQSCVC